jgi:hypothetical protein
MDENATPDMLNTSIEQLHQNMDCFPLTDTKVRAIRDLISDSDRHKDFLVDYSIYHERWSELTDQDFKRLTGDADVNRLMGGEQRTQVYNVGTEVYTTEPGSIMAQDTVCMTYLKRLISECQEKGIQVVTTFLPMGAPKPEDMDSAVTAQAISEEFSVPYINMIDNEIGLDLNLDYNDPGHLNSSGMQKVSAYLGSQLAALNLGLKDHRNEAGYEQFTTRAIQRLENQINLTREAENLNSTLMTMAGESTYSYILYVRGGSEVFDNEYIRRLVTRLSGTGAFEDAAEQGGPYMLLKGICPDEDVRELPGPGQPEPFATRLGDMTLIETADFGAIYLNGNLDNNLLDMEEHYEDDVQLLLIDKENGEITDHLYFDL